MAKKVVKEVTVRLTPTKETLSRLFALSGNVCAFPGCDHPVFDDDFELVAQVCHIEGAMPDGERFNEKSNNEDRRKLENLMAMCLRHHVKTNDVLLYSVKKLQDIKAAHEAPFTEAGRQKAIPRIAVDKAYEQEKRISEHILLTVKSTETKVDQLIAMNEQLTTYVTANLPVLSDSPFKSEIETILSLRETSNQQAAIDLLIKFREKNWNNLTEQEKYRVLANLGICYLEINKEQDAAGLFLEAYQYQPDLTKAKSLAALGYTIKGDQANALKMVDLTLQDDPTNADAYQALIHTRSLEGHSLDQIIAGIPEDLHQNTEIAYAIGFVARQRGSLNDAINWFQIALENAGDSKANVTGNLASTVLETVDGASFVLNGTIDQPSKNRVNLAVEYFNEALGEVNGTSLLESRAHWLMNRGVAKKFLGDRQGAYEDMLKGNSLVDDFATSRHLAIAAMEFGAKDKMWECLHKMQQQATNEDEKQQADLFIAELDIAEGRKDKGIAALEELLANGLYGKEGDYVRNKLVQLYTLSGKVIEANKLIDQLLRDKPESVRTYLTQAQFFIVSGKDSDALESLEQARKRVFKETPPAEIHELAELFSHFNNLKQVAELLEMIADVAVYSPLTRQLLMAYFQAGENQKLISTCNNLLTAFGPMDMVTELLSWAYEGIDDLDSAIAVLTDYLSKYPDDQLIQARLAFVYYRLMDKDSLKALLDGIDHIDSTLPQDVQFKLAKMYRYIGEESKFRRFAYEIRRHFYDEASVHDAIVALSVPVEQVPVGNEELETISSNTAVIVRVNDTTVTYVIEDSEPVFASRGEISLKSKLGLALIGKKVGDTVTFEQEGLQQNFEVLQIIDKFDFAASESIRLLTTRFVADAKTKKINIPLNEDGSLDLEGFFAPLKQAEKADEYIEQVYKQEKLPIGVAAGFKRISPIRAWAGFMASSELGVFTTGPYQEMVVADGLIKSGKPLIMDILAITTLSSLNALDDLLLLPNEKIVTHSTLEELYDLIHEQEQSANSGTFTVGVVQGQYVKQVLSPETVQSQIQHLTELADWVKANCTVVPATAGLSMNALEKKDLDSKIGKSFLDSILTAKEKDGLLYAEEMPLRGYAYNDHRVNGCATFMVYRILKERKLIGQERYSEKILHLMAMNYKFIPVEADDIYQAAVKSKFTKDFPFNIAIGGLNSPLMLPGIAFLEAVKFFYKLYAEKVTAILSADNPDHIKTLVYATLDQLGKMYTADALQEGIMRIVDRLFQYIPIHQQQLRTIIRNYFTGK